MTALAALPAVTDYLAGQIADEVTLAKLLGYRKLEIPIPSLDFPCVIWGVRAEFKPLWEGSNGRAMLPRWRRGNDCMELVSLCLLTVSCGPTGVSVNNFAGDATCATRYADHPSKDEAIFWAICTATIAHLSAQRGAGSEP